MTWKRPLYIGGHIYISQEKITKNIPKGKGQPCSPCIFILSEEKLICSDNDESSSLYCYQSQK